MEGQAPAGAKQDRTKPKQIKQKIRQRKGELNYGYEYRRLSRIRKQVLRQHCAIPGGGARRKIFCDMNQKAQTSLGGLASIFGK